MTHKQMSIPEFISELSLSQLECTEELVREKIDEIRSKEKVKVFVFNSGVINEGFYNSEEEALQALKDYVNSKEFSVHDRVRVHSILQFKDEAQRLIYGG